MQWSIGIVVLVVVGIVVLVLAKSSKTSSDTTSSTTAQPAPASVTTDLAAVPLPAIAAAGQTASSNPVKSTDGKKRTVAGKPDVLYVGAEFCPYCAGERWPLVVALSKFGTFSGLKVLNSSEENVPTLSFQGSSYSSPYVSFTPIELQDQDHKPLDKATNEQLQLFQQLGGGAFPFIDFGGTSYQQGGSVDAQLLIGKTQTAIASELAKSTPKDTSPTSLQGNVNLVAAGFIRQICGLTNDQPGKVCKAIPAA